MIKQRDFITNGLIVCLAALFCQKTFAASAVEIFATSTQSLSGITPDMKRCNVDEMQQLTNMLNQQVDGLVRQGESQEQIEKTISATFAVNASHMSDDAMCLADAVNLEITQLPAVVVNNHVVVYGEYDVPTALLLALKEEDGRK